MTKQEYNLIRKLPAIFYKKHGFYLDCDLQNHDIYIEPSTKNRPKMAGMQILFDRSTKTFEVSEYQAGKNQNELHIFTETKSLKKAIKSLLKGNNRTPKIIWS